MKRLKTLLCVLLSITLVTGCLCADGLTISARGQERKFDIGVNPDSVTATLSEGGVLTVSGSGEIKDFTSETAPFAGLGVREIKIGADVKAIGNYTFYNCGGAGVITLPRGLVRIGDRAFSGDSLNTAIQPIFVENLFTEVTVTRRRDETVSEDAAEATPTPAPTSEPTATPVVSAEPTVTPTPALSDETDGTESEATLPEGGAVSEVVSEPEQVEENDEPVESGDDVNESVAVLNTEIQTMNAAAPTEEETVEDVTPAPEPTIEPTAEPDESASETTEGETTAEPTATPAAEESKYVIETLTEQEIGTEIFYPRADAPVFLCSSANGSFRAAMQAAGYREADSTTDIVLDCGEGKCDGNTVTKTVPVIDGSVVLPDAPQEFAAPDGGSLFEYSFGGWTEAQDSAGTVRAAGSYFAMNERTDLYFIANWNREILAKITIKRDGNELVLDVPSVDGYDFTAFRWQTCLMPTGVQPNEQGEEWADVFGETDKTCRQTVAAESGTRFYRCIVTVKKQTNLLTALFASEDSEELTLAAVSAEETVTKVTLNAPKVEGGGMAVVTQTITVPVSYAGSVYKITGAQVSGKVNLLLPSESENGATMSVLTQDQSADNTFALGVKTGATGWAENTDASAYLLSALPSGETEWNSGVEGVWLSGATDPITAADQAEIELSLLYDSGYESFEDGCVELILQEFADEESLNTVAIRVTLEGEHTGVLQSAVVAAGRSFSEYISLQNVEIGARSAVTASFATEYQPIVVGGAQSFLTLYRGGKACSFPVGTRIAMADMTTSGVYKYYFYTIGAEASQVALANFSGYFGALNTTARISEKLLFAVDFSHSEGLAAGEYYLMLTHSTEKPADWATAAFTVSGDSNGALTITPEKTEGSVWSFDLTAAAAANDTRYIGGAAVQISLVNAEGEAVALPDNSIVTAGDGTVVRASNGTALLMIPINAACAVKLDFTAVSEEELLCGEYKISAVMRPQAGLQSGGRTDATVYATVDGFTLTAASGDETQRAISLELADGSERLIDVTESAVEMKLDLTCGGVQTDDTLSIEILQKTGTTPDDSSYTVVEEDWTVTPKLSPSDKTETVTVTVPKGQTAGTYRVRATIVTADGDVAAEEVYNFIVKGRSA